MLITRGSFIPTTIAAGNDTSFLLLNYPPLPQEYTISTTGRFPLYPLPILHDNMYSHHAILLPSSPRTILNRIDKRRQSCSGKRPTLYLRKYPKMG